VVAEIARNRHAAGKGCRSLSILTAERSDALPELPNAQPARCEGRFRGSQAVPTRWAIELEDRRSSSMRSVFASVGLREVAPGETARVGAKEATPPCRA